MTKNMDEHVHNFFSTSSEDFSRGNFHRVVALHEAPDIDCETLCQMVPDLSKGWYELAVLDRKDRIEFTRDYWIDKLPYRKDFTEFLNRFFGNLDDIGIYISQKKVNAPFEACIIYSLKNNSGFYRGASAITEEKLTHLKNVYAERILPADYLAFLTIHDGFWKTTDTTGLSRSSQLPELAEKLQSLTSQTERLVTLDEKVVDPEALIPFYESFGMPFFQCFWADWYPEGEMGNVYYAGDCNKILFQSTGSQSENMAFPTFLDWLKFYLEQIA